MPLCISQPLCIMYMSNIYSYFMQISHVSCIWPSGCPCLFILSTRHNKGYIFCLGSFGYCKPRFIPNYVFMFWNRNWVFKLTTIDVPSGLQTRNSQSSVIHHHEFSPIGKFKVYICETLLENPIWILAGNCPTRMTSIVGMAYYHDTGHIPKISNHSLIM